MDEAHEHVFEELDARRNVIGGPVGKDGKLVGKKGKAVVPLEPPLKRSIKGEPKGTPLPPPLTSAPLAFKTINPICPASSASASSPPVPSATILHPIVKAEQFPVAHVPHPPPYPQVSPASVGSPPTGAPPSNASGHTTSPPQALPPTPSVPASAAPLSAIPASVRIPIVVGLVPASHVSNAPVSPPKPIVLHENTLILNPEIFSHLTPQHLQDLEALGAQKALEILQSYIVRYYKEKLKAESARGRGRGRPRRGRGGATGRGSAPTGTSAPANVPSATAPAPPRAPVPTSETPLSSAEGPSALVSSAPALEPPADTPSPIVVIDDDSSPEEHVAKRRRLEEPDVDIMAI